MSFTWHTMPLTGGIQEVDAYPSLEEALGDMAAMAWECAKVNTLVDWVTDDEKGEVVATALFGPGKELLVTCADGRRLTFDVPDFYKE